MSIEKRIVRNLDGRVLEESVIQQFKGSLRGRLLQPGDDGYESSRRIYNGMIDKHPGLMAKCAGVSDVINSVNFARENRLLLAVRSGGHGVAGNALCDGGLVIDLSGMKGMRVDPVRRTARAEPGVTWGEFDHETHVHGLATTGGLVSTTGIAGLTLGGGVGWLMNKYGLACDNLLSADVVTADGRFLTASADENQDLFWGLRGGGGNFGVVTSFEYRLHPLTQVLAGTLTWPLGKAEKVLQFFGEFTRDAPDEVAAIASISAEPHGAPAVGIDVCYAGPLGEAERVLAPLRGFGSPATDNIGEMSYPRLQDSKAPWGLYNYWRSGFLRDLSDDAVETVAAHSKAIPSSLSEVNVWSHHGAVNRVKPDATAFSHRGVRFNLEILSIWREPAESEKNLAWNRAFWSAMEPFLASRVYVNFLGSGEEVRIRAAYGENYERLVALKTKYDPTNLFRVNQNIKPTAPPA